MEKSQFKEGNKEEGY